ncbi:MAG: division/cell wall cluster transcriptional repressor MraZ [Chloroflexi bacterium]|nr:division/cell wall cluster transcriptional repressor MraZ [Chloroflexota bacterium]
MFLGEYVHSIDEKNRLAIPARFRQDLAEGVYLTKGVDRCLYLLAPDGWARLADRIAALPSMQADVRKLQRHFFAGAVHLAPDKLGRIVIPPNLREYAQLDGEVVVAGVHSRIELWPKSAWDAEQARVDDQTATIAEQMASLGI